MPRATESSFPIPIPIPTPIPSRVGPGSRLQSLESQRIHLAERPTNHSIDSHYSKETDNRPIPPGHAVREALIPGWDANKPRTMYVRCRVNTRMHGCTDGSPLRNKLRASIRIHTYLRAGRSAQNRARTCTYGQRTGFTTQRRRRCGCECSVPGTMGTHAAVGIQHSKAFKCHSKLVEGKRPPHPSPPPPALPLFPDV